MTTPAWARVGVWLLGRWLRARPTLVCALALVLAWMLGRSLAELGITGELRRQDGLFYEIALLSVGLASGLGAWVLGRHEWLWTASSRGQRAAAEAGFLLAVGVLASLPAGLGALASGAHLPWAPAGAALLHVWALAWLVTRAPTPSGLRPILLVSLIWWIPPLLGSEPEPLASLARWLGGPIHVAVAGGTQTRIPAPVDTAPAVACALAAWLLTPRTPRP